MCVGVRASYPSDNSGNVSIEMEEASGCHCLPVLSDGSYLFPIGLEFLQGSEINVGVFFPELLELADTECSLFQVFGASTREITAF